MEARRTPFVILPLLGALSVISPFSIDMYLTAFPQVAGEFAVSTNAISLTLSAYFIGLAGGQLFYGPLLDRFGRRPPLFFGLTIFLLASIGCAVATDIRVLIALRFLQGLGGYGAQVACLAMVRDFFPPKQSARILSSLFLFIAVSPLLAPTVGGLIVAALALCWFLLPEGHQPDRGISLKAGPIFSEYAAILRQPRFATYALAGAFSFAVYLSMSPARRSFSWITSISAPELSAASLRSWRSDSSVPAN
jgi:DHA1 family bicyclomycin/chloramphenicol resistance-like MFS transporter